MVDIGTAFRRIAEWHLPNRVIYAAENKIPLEEFWSFIPTRCHWCKRQQSIKKLSINGSMHLQCIQTRGCRPGGDEAVENGSTTSLPPKKVVIRRSTV